MKFTFREFDVAGDFQPPRTETDRLVAGFLLFRTERIALHQAPIETADGILATHRYPRRLVFPVYKDVRANTEGGRAVGTARGGRSSPRPSGGGSSDHSRRPSGPVE